MILNMLYVIGRAYTRIRIAHGISQDGILNWIYTKPWSDHYQIDHADYYQPYLRNFERGLFRGPTIGDLAKGGGLAVT